MSTPGLRERKNARTLASIQRAAFELALEQGFENTTVDQIAARADVSPRTVYVRFKTKDAIVEMDPEASSAAFAARLAEGDGDLIDRFDAVIRSGIEGRSGDELAALRHRATFGDPYLRGLRARQIDGIVPIIREQLVKELKLPKRDVRAHALATAMAGLLSAMAEYATDTPRAPRTALRQLDQGTAFLRAALEHLRSER